MLLACDLSIAEAQKTLSRVRLVQVRVYLADEKRLKGLPALYLKSWFCVASLATELLEQPNPHLKAARSALEASSTVTWNWPVQTASPSSLAELT